MNQRLSLSEAAPAVYKVMLVQASVHESGFERDLMDLACLHDLHRGEQQCTHG
jgi:hypothetical protein